MTFRSKAAAFGYPVRVFSSRSWPLNLNLIPRTWLQIAETLDLKMAPQPIIRFPASP
jgi:hypothetical protein